MSELIVRCHQVRKCYRRGRDTVPVLDGIDLEIGEGEFVALMGPSGSGKSTLLNLIGGLDEAGGGTLEVAGLRLDRVSRHVLAPWRAANIGFVFQFYNLLPVLDARQNVELPLLLTGLSGPKRRRRAELALAIVGLADRAGHRPRELSGGQQQRVAIARAIVADPPLLVCDEPTGDLDRASADEILDMLSILNRAHGKTVIIVTHDPRAASPAGRILRMDKGRLTGDSEAVS